MARWRESWDARTPLAPSALPTAPTRLPSWFLATASSARMQALPGYGGGVDRKRWLLAHEGAATPSLSGSVARQFSDTVGF